MATAVFQGASSDWDDTDNWSGGAGAGGVPANNDTVIIAQSSQDLDTNLTTGLTGITLRIGPGYTGQLGSTSAYLDLDGTADVESSGDVYLTGTLTTVTVHGGWNSANMLQLKANASTDIDTLRIVGGEGTVTVGGSAVLDDVEIIDAPNIKLTIAANVSSLDTITMDTGEVTCSSNMASTVEVRGGRLTVAGSATAATLNIEDGGTVLYNSSGTITTMTVYGLFDGRSNQNGSVTVTNCTIYDGGRMRLRNGLNTWTGFSNKITYYGGDIEFPVGSTVDIT